MKICNKLFVVISLTFSSILLAQNHNDILRLSEPGLGSSARALGMGNSFTAVADDYSAVFFNPAGLGLIKRFEFTGSINVNSFSNKTAFFSNNTNSIRNNFKYNQLGIVMPVPTIKGSWVFAVGYNRSKDFNRTLEFDGFNTGNNSLIQDITGFINDEIPLTYDLGLSYEVRDQDNNYESDATLIRGNLNQSGRIRTEGDIGNWSFATAFEVSRGLFIGGTFNSLSGRYKSNSDFYEDDTKNVYGASLLLDPDDSRTADFKSFYMNEIIEWELSGWDFTLGFLYLINRYTRFGASFKFPSHFKIEEAYSIFATSEFGSGSNFKIELPGDKIKYNVRTPFEFSTGVSSKYKMIVFSAELKVIDYASMEFTDGLGSNYRLDRNNEIDDLFRTAAIGKVGSEINIPILPIRGRIGFIYRQSPFRGDGQEFDKKYFTLGAGIILGAKVSLDLGYAYGWWQDFGDNYGFNESRTLQKISVNKFLLSFSTRI